ncbi:MAG: glutamine amidotransferase, partial [Myxococcales bacterium]
MRVLLLEGSPACFPHVTGTLALMGVAHDLVRPGCPLPADLSPYRAVLLSDFPHRRLEPLERTLLRAHTEWGLGLGVFGGMNAFGAGGYIGTPLARVLPVTMSEQDEAVRLPCGLALDPPPVHPVLRGARPDRPIVLTGFNGVEALPKTTTVLAGRALRSEQGEVRLGARKPLLVLKEAGPQNGRIAAYASSFVPPWSGGLCEWGDRLLDIGDGVQVGECFATLLINLVRWVAGEERIG